MQTTLKNRTIFCADNIDVLRGINTETVDLIYLDPPFNKNKIFTSPIGSKAEGASFRDIFRQEDVKKFQLEGLRAHHKSLAAFIASTSKLGNGYNKHYLIYMAVRLVEMHRILKQTGSLYLHCDPTMSHYLKLVLDGIFEEKNFRNEITWKRYRGKRSPKNPHKFPSITDSILFYSKSHAIFNLPFTPLDPKYVSRTYRYDDKDGRGKYRFGGRLRNRKYYLNESRGTPSTSLWDDVHELNGTNEEKIGYPTQKPIALLERIIQASTNEGDLVLDPFCGCATACIAAEKLNRKWIGIDVSAKAYELVGYRLNREVAKPKEIFKKKVFFREGNDAYVQRTDVKADKRPKKEIKKSLYGDQGGFCKLCDTHFLIQNLEMDHILARSKGGGDNYENLQLLCGRCNRIKGTKGMAEAQAIIQGKPD